MRVGIRAKLLTAVFVIVGISFVCCGFFATRYFQQTLEEQVISDEARKLEQTAAQLRYIQEEIAELAKYIVLDSTVQSSAASASDDVFVEMRRQLEMSKALRGYIQMKDDKFQGGYVITEDGRTFVSGAYLSGLTADALPEWYTAHLSAGLNGGFTGMHTDQSQSATTPVISYVLHFKEVETGTRYVGRLVLNVDLRWIEQAADISMEMLEGYVLYDRDGRRITGGGVTDWSYADTGAGPRTVLADGTRDMLLTQRGLEDGWVLAARVSRERILKKLRFVPLFFVAVFLSAMVAISLVLVPMVSRLTRPVSQLARSLENVAGGDFDTPLDIRTGDELEDLGGAFNRMRADLKAYVDQRVRHEKTVREMEIGRLMLQINPHFIYNTLGAIFYMAKESGEERIADFTQAFVSLLQDTLDLRSEGIYTTLGQELKNIRNYVQLQCYQYPDRFAVTYSIDEALMGCRVPSVLIQPLVENAIFHGVCAREQDGHIVVAAAREGGDLLLSVADNGAGMPPEQVGRLFAEPASYDGGAMRKIGMANVRGRVRYLYGAAYDIRVDSQLGQGTLVTVRIPYRKEAVDGQ